MDKKYDAIIIGAGQAGPSLAVRLAKSGKKVALIERKHFGGTCVNYGCIPSKTLIESAYYAHLVKKAVNFGIHINGSVNVDMKQVKARKDAIVQKYATGVEDWLKNTSNCTLYHTHALFENPHRIRVGDESIEGDKIFINVGARASILPIPGLEKIKYMTNSSVMEIDSVPKHLIIVGGSYIALEFAQLYRRLGAQVTIIEKVSRLIAREDPDISEAIQEILEGEGILVKTNTECFELDQEGENIHVKLNCKEEEKEIIGSHLLLATGRKPNTDDLGLDKAGIVLDKGGYIKVDDQLRTNVNHIWALGECNGQGAFTHTAYNDYEIVAGNLLNHDSRRVTDRILTYGLFIDPPLGRAGMTETEARKLGKKILIGKLPMTQVKRALIKGDTRGFMKVIIDAKTQHILGAAVLGVGGDEIIHSILDTMYAKVPYTVIQKGVHIHPTISELIPTMLGALKE